jgi:hypothetical protein
LSPDHGARLLKVQSHHALSSCAASLRGILDAKSRTLNSSFDGNDRALIGINDGQPNHSFNPTLRWLSFHGRSLRFCFMLLARGGLIRVLGCFGEN